VSALKICPQCGTEYELDQRFCPKDGSTLKSQGQGADLLGSIIADRYHVLKKLGEGGMGTVYLAEHVKMGRKSAVKVMNPGTVDDTDAISRFNREASNASRINHPNVAAVYDFGETSEGMIYLAMEFVEGPSLTQVIKEGGPLPPARAAEIARQAAEALSVAHDMGIVHRDLKPDNIMLAKNRDGSDCVKVVDFGIAKAANNEAQKVTRTGLVVGTPEYMSPEQLAGDKLDGRSDIYSLGLVAFAMMTGKLPFPGETAQESMIARLTDDPKRLDEMKPDVAWPSSVQLVMDKALARDAVDRYQSANQFGSDLHKAVHGMGDTPHQTTIMRASLSHKASTPSSNAAVPGSPAAKTKPIPATAVNKASKAVDVVPEPSRNRTPMLGGIAALVVVLATGGTYLAKNMDGGTNSGATPQGGQASGAVVPEINLPRELERITPLTDDVSDSMVVKAHQALEQLQRLDSLAQRAPDSTFLQFRYLRSKALLTSGSVKVGCDSLRNLESRLAKDPRYERAAPALLKNVCN
jgi:serine/threonine protein kinase